MPHRAGDQARPIRVAYCLDSFAIGGTELNAVRTAEALNPDRVALSVIHLQTRGPLRERYERLGVPMRHLPIPNLYSPRTALQGVRLAQLLRDWDIDVVHSHDIYCNIFAAPWARSLGGRAVISSRRWTYEAPRPELVTLNRWCYAFAHRVLANSRGVAELLVGEEKIAKEKVVEIPNFLAESAFVPASEEARLAQRRAWGVPDDAFLAGIVARLSPVKNHALLLNAAAQLDGRFHMVLIGEGPSRAALESLVNELGIASRVHFAGEIVSQENLHRFFDASVLCSTSEGFPNALIEAMAAGRPVVATPVGGVVDAVTDGVSGLLVPVDDPARLAAALRSLASDPGTRARLAAAGREVARTKYRQDVVIAQLVTLYEELAGRTPAPSLVTADG